MPVCKKCRNYVMKFPCPHCGSDLTMSDRTEGEIQPIVPKELQGDFEEPPPPAYVDGRPEMRAPQPKAKKIATDLSRAKTAEFKAPKSDFSSQTTTSTTSSLGTKDLIASSMDQRLTNIETTLKTLTTEITTIMKSQKVIESILKKINSQLMKLRES